MTYITTEQAAEQAVTATHELALLTRPAITCLDAAEIAGIANTLTSLAAAVNQTLRQLSNYTAAGHASAGLQHAATLAGQLVGALNTAHHNLGDTAEPPESEPGGVNFRPTKRGQISTGVDTDWFNSGSEAWSAVFGGAQSKFYAGAESFRSFAKDRHAVACWRNRLQEPPVDQRAVLVDHIRVRS